MWFTLSCLACYRRRRQRLHDEMHFRQASEGDALLARIGLRERGWHDLSADEYAAVVALHERQLREVDEFMASWKLW